MQQSDALWYVSSGQVELRPGIVDTLRDGDVLIGARYSAISRGTERLVLRGHIPSTEHDRMRCPHQEGSFPFPVKYGYAVVGKILAGPADRIGQAVFALHPHQRARWPTSRRLKVALELLCNSVFDALLTQDIAFDDAPAQLAQALAADSSGLTTVLTYT